MSVQPCHQLKASSANRVCQPRGSLRRLCSGHKFRQSLDRLNAGGPTNHSRGLSGEDVSADQRDLASPLLGLQAQGRFVGGFRLAGVVFADFQLVIGASLVVGDLRSLESPQPISLDGRSSGINGSISGQRRSISQFSNSSSLKQSQPRRTEKFSASRLSRRDCRMA